MSVLLWLLALSACAFALWLVSAFALRLRQTGRLLVTLGIPALLTSAVIWARYLEDRGPASEPGWDAVFLIVSVFAGALSGAAMLPVWFLAERKLGWRARD